MAATAFSLLAVIGLASSGPTSASDFGRVGQAFPVIETDMLAAIESRLRRAETSGELARVNAMFAKRVEVRVKRPPPVAGLAHARESRSWDYDPSISIGHDVRDRKGNLIAAAGQRINPLDFVSIRQELVFIDGSDPAQLDWATHRYGELEAKIVFVAGSPFEEMTTRKRRFYFDQEGKLTAKFGIRHTPAVVSGAGRTMRVSEVALSGKGAN